MSTSLIDSNGFINPGLSSNLMRLSIETKNLLKNKGDIYIGGSEKIRVNYGEEIIIFRKIEKLSAGNNNSVFCKISSGSGGISWSRLNYRYFSSANTYPMEVKNAYTAQNAAKVSEASVINYSSSDTSLGTIDVRLDLIDTGLSALGF